MIQRITPDEAMELARVWLDLPPPELTIIASAVTNRPATAANGPSIAIRGPGKSSIAATVAQWRHTITQPTNAARPTQPTAADTSLCGRDRIAPDRGVGWAGFSMRGRYHAGVKGAVNAGAFNPPMLISAR